MKKIFTFLAALAALTLSVRAQAPAATYEWNFNQTNVNSTNYLFTSLANGTVPETPGERGELRTVDGNGVSVNLLGLDGSGVSSGLFPNIPHDRALLVPGIYGANSFMARTPGDAYALTNLGVISNFTITCWAKFEGSQGAFPRIVMFGANGVDAGSPGLNAFGILFFNQYDIQLKIHNVSNPNSGNGMSTSSLPLASAATNWVFIAVSCDMTLPTGGAPNTGTNTVFYVGNRSDSFLAPSLAPGVSVIYSNYYTASVNSLMPGAAADGPGFVNFDATITNGDALTMGVSNVYVSIANRYNGTGANASGGNRAFNGRYDDIRLYANQVLTLAQVEAVRTNAPPALAGPLVVVQQPQNTTVAEGQGAAFTVATTEAANRTYQWYVIPRGIGVVSNALAGATSATLETTNLTVAGNNGDKYLVITHSTDPLSDNGGVGVKSAYVTATVLGTNQYVVTPGMLKFEYFSAPGGTSVNNFLLNSTPNYSNNTPDATLFMSSFDTRTVFPDNSHVGYFGKITGWITPTVTTNYIFYIRAGDQGELLLDLDGDGTTNNMTLVAADNRNGAQVFYGPEISGAGQGINFSFSYPLIAGSNYAVIAYVKQASGQGLLQVGWRMDSGNTDLPANDANLSDRVQPIAGSFLSSLDLPLGTVSIIQQPTATPSGSVKANSKVTLNIGTSSTTNSGSGPLVIQWQKNGVKIPGATGNTYITSALTASASYSAVVSMPGVVSNSQPVNVIVVADTVPPTVLTATGDDSMHGVIVQFSEPVDPVTALNPGHYSIPGLSVLSAAFATTTNLVDNPAYDTVRLTTSGQADNSTYTVTVTGVNDTAANTIAVGNKASFLSYGYVSGLGKFEYFENNYYVNLTPQDDFTVNGFVSYSPKFTNNDPDTIVYPRTLEMSPEGQTTFRSGGSGMGALPPGFFGTRMSALITPTNTTNYVFYVAADDTAILWLSTDDNPANKHAIVFANVSGSRQWNTSSAIDTNTLASQVTVPGATFWPIVDDGNVPVITLTNGQRYYIELDHREFSGGASVSMVTWDNGAGVAPNNGSPTVLTGSVIGWHFPQPQISSFAKSGNNFNITWNSALGSANLGAVPWPGIVAPETFSISGSFPTPALQATPSLSPAAWNTLTNTSTATIPITNSMQFFRIGE